MRFRDNAANDAAVIVRLLYETVHAVNRADYSSEQLRAWAPEVPGPAVWHRRMAVLCTLGV